MKLVHIVKRRDDTTLCSIKETGTHYKWMHEIEEYKKELIIKNELDTPTCPECLKVIDKMGIKMIKPERKIEIRSISTEDVKIAQKALESVGFITSKEGDFPEAYWVELIVPYNFFESFPQFKPRSSLRKIR